MIAGALLSLLQWGTAAAISAALAATGAAKTDPAATVQACLGREDPQCAESAAKAAGWTEDDAPWLYGRVALLRGQFQSAHKLLERAADAGSGDGARVFAAESELAGRTHTLLSSLQKHPILGGKAEVWLRKGKDELLLPGLEEVLTKAIPQLERAFGPVATPLVVHVYARAEDLATVSGLTVQQIRTSGTIALCKYNRLMLTSPQDLVFGYGWADTLAHELVHWYIIKRGGPAVPVWMHEGLARGLQGLWRGRSPLELDRDERLTLLAARKKGKFITWQQMHPSMALLPSQEDTALAFAEVHHALAWMLQRAAGEGRAPETEAGRLIGLFGQGHDEAAALQAFGGMPRDQLQATWKKALAKLDLKDDLLPDGQMRRPMLVFRGAGDAAARVSQPDARRHAELGDRLLVAGRPLAAAIEYQKALSFGGTDGPLLVTRLIRVLLDLGRYKDAEELLTPALADHPEHAPLHILHARAHVLQSRWQQALEATRVAYWFNPFDPQLHQLEAEAYAALGQRAAEETARQRARLVAEPRG